MTALVAPPMSRSTSAPVAATSQPVLGRVREVVPKRMGHSMQQVVAHASTRATAGNAAMVALPLGRPVMNGAR